MVICLERGADFHMAQLMPLPLTVSCSSKIQIGFTFLVPAYPGCHGKRLLNGSSSSSSSSSNEGICSIAFLQRLYYLAFADKIVIL